jgi:hypothetical protein
MRAHLKKESPLRCGLSEVRLGFLIRWALDLAGQLYSKPSTEIHDGKYHI